MQGCIAIFKAPQWIKALKMRGFADLLRKTDPEKAHDGTFSGDCKRGEIYVL